MLKLFPWDFENTKPYWVNPQGFEWWVDENTTQYANNKKQTHTQKNIPPLNATGFFVVRVENDKRIPVSRVLISNDDNTVLADETSLENMGCKIDILRLARTID